MRKFLLAPLFMAVSTVHANAATPSTLTMEKLLDICTSATVPEAATKGDVLGWPRMTEAQTKSWRASFLQYNGGSVSMVGWKRPQQTGETLLSFWIATGPNAHRSCSYTSADATGLLDALSKQLGAPASLDRSDASTSARWQHGQRETTFTQVKAGSALINVSDRY
jgi:hypothetical protein